MVDGISASTVRLTHEKKQFDEQPGPMPNVGRLYNAGTWIHSRGCGGETWFWWGKGLGDGHEHLCITCINRLHP